MLPKEDVYHTRQLPPRGTFVSKFLGHLERKIRFSEERECCVVC